MSAEENTEAAGPSEKEYGGAIVKQQSAQQRPKNECQAENEMIGTHNKIRMSHSMVDGGGKQRRRRGDRSGDPK